MTDNFWIYLVGTICLCVLGGIMIYAESMIGAGVFGALVGFMGRETWREAGK